MSRTSKLTHITFVAIAVVSSALFLLYAYAQTEQGARLYFSPATNSVSVGRTFVVEVLVDSGGDPGVNSSEGTINFDPQLLSVVDISQDDSIFNLWVTEPTFSNAQGVIEYAGGGTSAYTGSAGTIFTVTFRALGEGEATVVFSDASALAADGSGSEALEGTDDGVYTVGGAATPPPTPTPTPTRISPPPPTFSGSPPAAPVVDSDTHPNPDEWYKENSPNFSWNIPSSVNAVRLLIDHEPDSVPTVLYTPPISERQIDDLEDGEWYFHIQMRNPAGWGGITHRKVLIDTAFPSVFDIVLEGEDPNFVIKVPETPEDMSGASHYEVFLGESDEEPDRVEVETMQNAGYQVPELEAGEYSVRVRFYDNAGWYSQATTTIITAGPVGTPTPTPTPPPVEEEIDQPWYLGIDLYLYIALGALLVALLVLFIFHTIAKKRHKKEIKKAKRETEEVRVKVGNIFSALNEEIQEQIEKINKSQTIEDKLRRDVVGTLRAAVEISEELIEKELDEIDEVFEE